MFFLLNVIIFENIIPEGLDRTASWLFWSGYPLMFNFTFRWVFLTILNQFLILKQKKIKNLTLCLFDKIIRKPNNTRTLRFSLKTFATSYAMRNIKVYQKGQVMYFRNKFLFLSMSRFVRVFLYDTVYFFDVSVLIVSVNP